MLNNIAARRYQDFWSLLDWLRGWICQGDSGDIKIFGLCWIGFGIEFAKASRVISRFLVSVGLVSGLDLVGILCKSKKKCWKKSRSTNVVDFRYY